MADLRADQMPEVSSAPDYDVVPSVPADVDPAAGPPAVDEVPHFAAAGTGREEGPRGYATADDAPLAPSPASSLSWVFPEPGTGPSRAAAPRFRGVRTRRRAGVAAAGVLGVVIVGALAIWLVPRLDPDPSSAGSAAPPAAQSSGAGQSAQPTSPPPQEESGLALTQPELAEANVVLEYFAAINSGHLKIAWQLGGDNLYPSTSAGLAAYAGVSHLYVTVLDVKGDLVLARIRTIYNTGLSRVHRQLFTVEDGVIVASEQFTGVS